MALLAGDDQLANLWITAHLILRQPPQRSAPQPCRLVNHPVRAAAPSPSWATGARVAEALGAAAFSSPGAGGGNVAAGRASAIGTDSLMLDLIAPVLRKALKHWAERGDAQTCALFSLARCPKKPPKWEDP